jgi:hypothetical protein
VVFFLLNLGTVLTVWYFLLNLGTVLTVWYFFIKFRNCSDSVVFFLLNLGTVLTVWYFIFFHFIASSDKAAMLVILSCNF